MIRYIKKSFSHLEIELEGLLEFSARREALIFSHEVSKSEVTVGALLLREEDWIVEAEVLSGRQPLVHLKHLHI